MGLSKKRLYSTFFPRIDFKSALESQSLDVV